MRGALRMATADLTWYFERGIPMVERSPSGYMLERADTFKPRQRRDPERAIARRERRQRMRATGEWEPSPDELTAVPMHEVTSSNRVEPDVEASLRKGKVETRLKALALEDPQAARALGAAFGHAGAKWAHHERGRNVALFPLTEAGRELVDRAKRASTLDLNDAERLYIEVEIDRLSRLREARGSKATPVAMARRRLITMAEKEAAELLASALELWVRTK